MLNYVPPSPLQLRKSDMIVDNKEPVHDAFGVPLDLPPAYDDIDVPRSTSPHAVLVASTSSENAVVLPQSSFSWSRRNKPLPEISGKKLHRPNQSFSSGAKKHKTSTPAIVSPKSQNDVRETVRGLVRDVVQGSSPVRCRASDACGVLESCAEACSRHSVSFARILQERSIEGHAPIYWAIVSRRLENQGPSKVDTQEDDAFLVALLEHAAPLSRAALSELRTACLVASSNMLFQQLRSVPGVNLLSGAERMLLSSASRSVGHWSRNDLEKPSTKGLAVLSGFKDVAQVCEARRDVQTELDLFVVHLELKMFQRRMRVCQKVEVEFIARGRLWHLAFFVVPALRSANNSPPQIPNKMRPEPSEKVFLPSPISAATKTRGLVPGTWAVALSVMEGSTQCYAEARLVIPEPNLGNLMPTLPPNTHSHSATAPTCSAAASAESRNPVMTHPMTISQSGYCTNTPFPRPSRRSFFRRNASEGDNTDKFKKSRPPIILNLYSSGTSPLTPLPSKPTSSSFVPTSTASSMSGSSDDELEESTGKPKAKPKRRRPTREEKRAARAAAKKEQRAREGRETKKDKKENTKLAETVLIIGLEENRRGMGSTDTSKALNRKKEQLTATGGELMHDGCPYILPDGCLRVVLEARISTLPPEPPNTSDCVIC